MTPHNPEITTAGPADNTAANSAVSSATDAAAGTAQAADMATHITVEGFDSLVPEVIDLDAPRDGVPLVIETRAGLERCAAAAIASAAAPIRAFGTYFAGEGQPRWGWRTELDDRAEGALRIRMFNVTPAGEESLGVAIDLARDPVGDHRAVRFRLELAAFG